MERLKREKEYWQGDDRILGDGDFVANALKVSEEEMEKTEELLRKGWNLDRLAKMVCQSLSVNPKELNKKGRANNLSQAKSAISYLANKKLGISRADLADYFQVSRPAITYIFKSGEKVVQNYKLESLF